MFNLLENLDENSETLYEARIGGRGLSLSKEILKFIVVLLVVILVLASVQLSLHSIFNPSNVNTSTLLILFSTATIILFSIVYILKFEKRNLRSIGFTKKDIISSCLRGFLLGFLMFITVVIIGMFLGEYELASVDMSSIYWALPFLIAFFIQSFEEEIFSRGWMLVSISRKNSVLLAIILNSAVFLILHLGNKGLDIIAVINILLFSFLLSIIFLKVDNIWFCGSLHASWNFTQGYLTGFIFSGQENISSLLQFKQAKLSMIGGNAFEPESGLIVTLLFLVMIIIFLHYDVKFFKE